MKIDKTIKFGCLVKFNNWSPEKGFYTCYGRVKNIEKGMAYIAISKTHHAQFSLAKIEKVYESKGDWIMGILTA